MAILFHEAAKEFHLYNNTISYIIKILDNGHLGQLYFGSRISDRPDFDHLLESCYRPMASYQSEGYAFSLEHIKQEYPVYGTTDFKLPAMEILQKNGSRITDFTYQSHRIYSGKPGLEGLPATYTELDEEADTLEVTLKDELLGLRLILLYTIFSEEGIIARSARFENPTEDSFDITRAMSLSLDLPDCDYDWIQFSGAWSRERQVKTRRLEQGIQSVSSTRGHSSNTHNPFVVLKRPTADEFQGEVMGFSLIYSGNFLAQAEVDTYNVTRVMLGINPFGFTWHLAPGEKFQTPEAVTVYSQQGLNGMSQTFHRLYRSRLARGEWRDKVRPILLNNWEATYFDFDEDKLVEIARAAKADGVELFVLDDGWFGARSNDYAGLGDWYANKDRLPNGIKGLSEKIEALGMKFGLWFEPEMVSPDSDLYRSHPDWCIHVPGRMRTECRNQLILDLSRQEVRDHIVAAVSHVLDTAEIGYVKWDMNRHMTELGSAGLDSRRQKEMPHRYMLGLYEVLEKIVSSHPDVLFESCSGGGGRFDPGMLYYMPQTWTSDDTDAVERLSIQYGTSLAYPVSTMGSHVSAVPNHQAGRVTSLKMRGDVAMSGNFGYELDLMRLTVEEKEMVRGQIRQYKDLRTFVPSADMYRLLSPFDGNHTAWMFVSKDGNDIFAAYFEILCEVNPGIRRMKFTALDPDAVYEVVGEGCCYRGDELMEIGLVVDCFGDFQSRTWRLKKN